MAYIINKNNKDVTNVPNIVFARLENTEDEWLRIALYIIKTGTCDENEISKDLRIRSKDKIKQALLFWKGAGLIEDSCLENEHSALQEAEKQEKPAQRKVHLNTQQVSKAAEQNKKISFLLQECQRLLGGVVTQGDCNIFASMYISDAMPIDMILLGVAHFAAMGKKNARYIERALLSWQRDGINSGRAAEAYLHGLIQKEEYVKRALGVFSKENMKVSKAESLLICDWFEAYGYDEAMIAEAIAHAGEKKTVKYVNGILRRWYDEGHKTLQDLMQSSADKMQNISVSNPGAKSVLNGKIKKVPVFVSGGKANE